MSTTATYYVGGDGLVKKLTNLTAPWIDVSLGNYLVDGKDVTLLDVETSTTYANKVFAVGTIIKKRNYFGIYVSTDGGLTWTIPTGDYTTTSGADFRWYEVSVVSDNVIYVSGISGYVCKSTDGGLTFNLCTRIPPVIRIYGDDPTYEECTSLHFISNNIGVVGLYNNTAFTLDGGTTWSISCNGLGIGLSDIQGNTLIPNPGTIVGVHLSADNQQIVATGTSHIVKSDNVGTSFYEVYQWAGRNGLHLTWLNDNYLWSFGSGQERIRSIDGGNTWSILSNYLSTGATHRAGHFYKTTDGFYSSNSMMGSTSSSGSNSDPSDDATPHIIHAVWTFLVPPTCSYLHDCDGEIPDILINNDLSAYTRPVIRLCNQRPVLETITSSANYQYSYILHDCCNELNDIRVNADLEQYINYSLFLPHVFNRCWSITRTPFSTTHPYINLTGAVRANNCTECMDKYPCRPLLNFDGCKCFEILSANTCEGAITIDITASDIYINCPACQPTCYLLTNCLNVEDFIITTTDLNTLVGLTVTLNTCPSKCWLVSESDTCTGAIEIAVPTVTYTTCAACLPKEPQTVITINHRLVQPGYNTPTCDPAYYEKVMCRYAEIAYKEMAVQRYGITTCCPEDSIKWEIKKWLIDLSSIYDESLCQTVICCPPCNVTASIQAIRFT